MGLPTASANAIRGQANLLVRLASYATAAAALAALLASASPVTFLLSALQIVAVTVALVHIRLDRSPKALGWLGLALIAAVGSLGDSVPTLDPVLLLADLANLTVVGLAWRWTSAAGQMSRAAYAAEKRALRDSHQRDRDLDRGFMERAQRERAQQEQAPTEDELIYLDDLAEEPAPNA